MSKQVIRYKNSQEWLSDRRNGIGASEVGTILGLNPFETPYQLWRRKKGLDAPKQENFAMKAGHYLEDAVSLFYRDALVFSNLESTCVSLKSRKSGRGVMMEFSDFPMLGIWSAANDGPYVALEPWTGCATAVSESGPGKNCSSAKGSSV